MMDRPEDIGREEIDVLEEVSDFVDSEHARDVLRRAAAALRQQMEGGPVCFRCNTPVAGESEWSHGHAFHVTVDECFASAADALRTLTAERDEAREYADGLEAMVDRMHERADELWAGERCWLCAEPAPCDKHPLAARQPTSTPEESDE